MTFYFPSKCIDNQRAWDSFSSRSSFEAVQLERNFLLRLAKTLMAKKDMWLNVVFYNVNLIAFALVLLNQAHYAKSKISDVSYSGFVFVFFSIFVSTCFCETKFMLVHYFTHF